MEPTTSDTKQNTLHYSQLYTDKMNGGLYMYM